VLCSCDAETKDARARKKLHVDRPSAAASSYFRNKPASHAHRDENRCGDPTHASAPVQKKIDFRTKQNATRSAACRHAQAISTSLARLREKRGNFMPEEPTGVGNQKERAQERLETAGRRSASSLRTARRLARTCCRWPTNCLAAATPSSENLCIRGYWISIRRRPFLSSDCCPPYFSAPIR
jgi:hypothetical protein